MADRFLENLFLKKNRPKLVLGALLLTAVYVMWPDIVGSRKKVGKRKKYLRGLVNRGNLCYANSVLQSLSSVDPLYTVLSTAESKSPLITALTELFSLLRIEESQPVLAISASSVLNALEGSTGKYISSGQQDAHELLVTLLSVLETELKHNNLEVVFSGVELESVRCLMCHSTSTRTTHFQVLELMPTEEPLKPVVDEIEGAKCDECNQVVCKTRTSYIPVPPALLCVHTNQSLYSNGMASYTGAQPNTDLTLPSGHELVSMVIYSGNHHYGHYRSVRKTKSGWWLISDSSIEELDEDEVKKLGSTACLRFYQLTTTTTTN